VVGKDIILVFDLNYFIYEQFKEGDKGRIIFKDCLMYRVGDPNDEGFYGKNNNSAWKASTAEKLGWENYPEISKSIGWDNFYEIEGSDWKSITEFGGTVIKEVENKQEYKHYVFFMKDGTFECVARTYSEEIPMINIGLL